jgi:coenzyme F420-reducing hydrogenase beta subunit
MKHYVVLSEGSNARHVIGVFCTHEKAYKHAKEYIKKREHLPYYPYCVIEEWSNDVITNRERF